MRKLFLSILMVSVVTGITLAASPDAGTSAAQFLKLGAGARASGMGDAVAAIVDDATALYWNPAGLSGLTGGSLSVMHAQWLSDISYEWAAYACPVSRAGAVGAGVQYLSYGSLNKRDVTGLETGTLAPSDLSAAVSYAHAIGRTSVGVSLKYIATTIEHTALAYAADIGVQRAFGARIQAGAAVQNIGSGMQFNGESDPLPLNIKLGGACAVTRSLIVAADVNQAIDDEITAGTGLEYVCAVAGGTAVAVRIGYSTAARDTGGFNGMAAGLGCTFQDVTIDYAFVPYGELGNTQRISLAVRFARNAPAVAGQRARKTSVAAQRDR